MAVDESITTPVLVLIGPTAIGKTDLSLRIAAEFDCEIISMDSMQVYRYMDIGTAKVGWEERRQVAHHLIDILEPDEQYDAACFVRDALAAIKIISSRGKIPLITGGTGLYLTALINGLFDAIDVSDEVKVNLRQRLVSEGREELYREMLRVDPESGARIHKNDTQRLLRGLEIFHSTGVPWSEHLRRQTQSPRNSACASMLHLGLTCSRELLYDRIKTRSIGMMHESFQEEVELLLAKGFARNLPSMQSIGYRHMSAWLAGELDLQTATAALIQDTRRYAKRQMTWFRHHQVVRWHEIHCSDEVLVDIELFLQEQQQGPRSAI